MTESLPLFDVFTKGTCTTKRYLVIDLQIVDDQYQAVKNNVAVFLKTWPDNEIDVLKD